MKREHETQALFSKS